MKTPFARRFVSFIRSVEARRLWRDRLLRKLGLQRSFIPPALVGRRDLTIRSCLRFLVAHELLHNEDFAILQIGAFDGVGDDDLYELITKHRPRGLLVEPQPEAFERLKETYRDHPQLTFLNAAIAEQEGTRVLYRRRGKSSMVASFDRDHLVRHGIPSEEVVEYPVACHTVASALEYAGLEHVDLIQIDAEGYDDRILLGIDFTRYRPAILRFEYRHLSVARADACAMRLAGYGYQFLVEERDVLAWHAERCATDGPSWHSETDAAEESSEPAGPHAHREPVGAVSGHSAVPSVGRQ